jgi:hypothetical protein
MLERDKVKAGLVSAFSHSLSTRKPRTSLDAASRTATSNHPSLRKKLYFCLVGNMLHVWGPDSYHDLQFMVKKKVRHRTKAAPS